MCKYNKGDSMNVKSIKFQTRKSIDWSVARSRNLEGILHRISVSTTPAARKTEVNRSILNILGKFCSS
jgi:hypothetical protein